MIHKVFFGLSYKGTMTCFLCVKAQWIQWHDGKKCYHVHSTGLCILRALMSMNRLCVLCNLLEFESAKHLKENFVGLRAIVPLW